MPTKEDFEKKEASVQDSAANSALGWLALSAAVVTQIIAVSERRNRTLFSSAQTAVMTLIAISILFFTRIFSISRISRSNVDANAYVYTSVILQLTIVIFSMTYVKFKFKSKKLFRLSLQQQVTFTNILITVCLIIIGVFVILSSTESTIVDLSCKTHIKDFCGGDNGVLVGELPDCKCECNEGFHQPNPSEGCVKKTEPKKQPPNKENQEDKYDDSKKIFQTMCSGERVCCHGGSVCGQDKLNAKDCNYACQRALEFEDSLPEVCNTNAAKFNHKITLRDKDGRQYQGHCDELKIYDKDECLCSDDTARQEFILETQTFGINPGDSYNLESEKKGVSESLFESLFE